MYDLLVGVRPAPKGDQVVVGERRQGLSGQRRVGAPPGGGGEAAELDERAREPGREIRGEAPRRHQPCLPGRAVGGGETARGFGRGRGHGPILYAVTFPRLRRAALVAFGLVAGAVLARAQAPREPLRIVVVGDINLARLVARTYVLPGRGAEVFAAVRDSLRAADIALGNLESLIYDRGTFADTALSPVFAAPALAAPLLAGAGFTAVSTANNHAWDFGHPALLESLVHLDSAGVAHAGTGRTVADALRPAMIRRRGWTVAVFSVTATFNYPDLTVRGHAAECCVAWADTVALRSAFRSAREGGADLVLVMLHAGLEYRPVPPADVVAIATGIIHAGRTRYSAIIPTCPRDSAGSTASPSCTRSATSSSPSTGPGRTVDCGPNTR